MLKRFGAMALVCLAAAISASAQVPSDRRGEHRIVPVGQLPVCNAARKGFEVWVTGLNSTAACSGTGSAETYCSCDGTAWQVRPGASGSVPDGDKGEVSVTGGAWTIDDNVADHPPTFANTTAPGSMNCSVVGTVHIQTNATPPLKSICITTGTPGTWASGEGTASGTAATSTVACSRIGQIYVETDNLPPSLHVCTAPGAAGAATWQAMNSPAGMFGSGGVLSCAINGCTITGSSLTGSMLQDSTIPSAKINDVAYTKLTQVPTDRVLCRDTATTGVAEACTLGIGLEFDGSVSIRRSAISGDVIVPAGSNTATVQPDSVALGTDTTGNYAAGTAEGGAATSGDDAGGFFPTGTMEHARLPPFLRATVDLVVDAANAVWAVTGGIVFEGSSPDDFETTLQAANPTADRTWTLPNQSGTVAAVEDLLLASEVVRANANSSVADEVLTSWASTTQDDPAEGLVAPGAATGSNCGNKNTEIGQICVKPAGAFTVGTDDLTTLAWSYGGRSRALFQGWIDGYTVTDYQAWDFGGAGCTHSLLAAEAGHPGIARLQVGTGTADNCFIRFGSVGTITVGDGPVIWEAMLRVGDLPTASDAFNLYCGLLGGTNPHTAAWTSQKFAMFVLDPDVAFWRTDTNNSGAPSATSSAAAVVADTWYRLTIEVNPAWSSIVFSVDGTVVATDTTTLPSSGSVSALCRMTKSAGSNARDLDIDFMEFQHLLTTPAP